MINQVLILSKPTILCLQKKIIIARLYFSSFASKICKLNIFLLKFSNRSLAPNFGVQKSVEQEIKLVWPNNEIHENWYPTKLMNPQYYAQLTIIN